MTTRQIDYSANAPLVAGTEVSHGIGRFEFEAGGALDTSKYFIIAVDAVGAGTSSKPSDGLGERFPAYNIRDMVRAELALVSQVFGISRLRAVVGASMGRLRALGYEPKGTQNAKQVADFVTAESRKWGDLIRAAGLKAE